MNTQPVIVVDWFRLLWDLVQRGDNLQIVADTTGIGRTTLRGYLQSSQPPHWRGERLIDHWMHRCGQPREAAPTTTLVLPSRVAPQRGGPVLTAADAAELQHAVCWPQSTRTEKR